MTLVAVSADSVEETLPFIEDEDIGFPIALDPDGETIRKWGLSEKGEKHSVPAAFVLVKGRVVRFVQVGESMGDRVDLDELIDVLDRP